MNSDHEDSWTILITCASQPEAVMLQGLLNESGIETVLRGGDGTSGVHPPLGLASDVQILVRKSEMERARQALRPPSD